MQLVKWPSENLILSELHCKNIQVELTLKSESGDTSLLW